MTGRKENKKKTPEWLWFLTKFHPFPFLEEEVIKEIFFKSFSPVEPYPATAVEGFRMR